MTPEGVVILTAAQIKGLQKDAAKEALTEFMRSLPRHDTPVVIKQPEQYTKESAAAILGISRTTLYTRLREGRLLVNREGKITREEIDRFKNNFTFSPQDHAVLD